MLVNQYTEYKMKKYKCALVDVCLPDYWTGTSLPYASALIWQDMTLEELKQSIIDEIDYELVANAPEHDYYDAFRDAVNALEVQEGATFPFSNISDLPTRGDIERSEATGVVMGYFVFVEQREESC